MVGFSQKICKWSKERRFMFLNFQARNFYILQNIMYGSKVRTAGWEKNYTTRK